MKLLILAYDFPPLISIGGLRPASWYKYFSAYGVDVTIITRDWENEKNKGTWILENGTTGAERKLIKLRQPPVIKDKLIAMVGGDKFPPLRKAITYLFSFFEFISLKADPNADLYYEADRLLKNTRFDFIIATGKPFILFRYAALLAGKYNIPWVADYRDSWTMNHKQATYSLSLLQHIQNFFFRQVERKYVNTASIVTTVAPSYIEFLPAYVKSKTAIVYNGYDDDIEKTIAGISPPQNKFIISYAGILYWLQRPEVFLEGVNMFVKENNISEQELEIHFWGIDQEAVARLMSFDANLKNYIHVHDKVSYVEVMKQLSHSNLLLLLTSGSDTWLNAKLFDYLVLKRPILMTGSQTNVMAGILKDTNAGITVDNASDVAAYITTQYKTYKEGKPNNTVNYQQYSRKSQVAAFYKILQKTKS